VRFDFNLSNVGNDGSIRSRGVISDEGLLCPWVDKKRKLFAFGMSRARVKSGAWGQRKPDYEVDMEILRGLENLGAPWDSMGRFPVINKPTGIIQTIGANMILDMWKHNWKH
jgi:hypothetical protein